MSEYKRPIPQPTPLSEPFFEGARRHELLVMRCTSCGRHRLTERAACPECWSNDYEWVRASGRGSIYSYVMMHQKLHPGFEDSVPYNIVVVDLEEGPRMVSNVVGCRDDQLQVGLQVEATFDDITPDVTLVRFQIPAAEHRDV